MTRDQQDALLDLFMLCKLASSAWLDIAPINQRNGSDFKELSDVKVKVDECDDLGIAQHKIFHVLSTTLPAPVFYKAFPAFTGSK